MSSQKANSLLYTTRNKKPPSQNNSNTPNTQARLCFCPRPARQPNNAKPCMNELTNEYDCRKEKAKMRVEIKQCNAMPRICEIGSKISKETAQSTIRELRNPYRFPAPILVSPSVFSGRCIPVTTAFQNRSDWSVPSVTPKRSANHHPGS